MCHVVKNKGGERGRKRDGLVTVRFQFEVDKSRRKRRKIGEESGEVEMGEGRGKEFDVPGSYCFDLSGYDELHIII